MGMLLRVVVWPTVILCEICIMDIIKDRLKYKPEVHPHVGVKVVVGRKTTIEADRDSGDKAIQMLEKIKQHNANKHVVNKTAPDVVKINPIITNKAKAINQKLKLIFEDEDDDDDDGAKHDDDDAKHDDDDDAAEKHDDDDAAKNDAEKHAAEKHDDNDEQEIIAVKRKGTRTAVQRPRVAPKPSSHSIPVNYEVIIQGTTLSQRLPPPLTLNMRVSNFYMNNRETFVNFINSLFEPYKADLLDDSKGISCENIGKDNGNVGLLTHQKIVRDYMNLHTPYRRWRRRSWSMRTAKINFGNGFH